MSALEGTTTIPVVGKVKKAYAVAGVALVAGVVGYAWWRRSQTATDAGTPDFYADTRTGSDLPSGGYSNPGGIDTSQDDEPGWKAPKTDQEWAQAVVEKLPWYEPGFVSASVGKYLAGSMLTADEANVIREAWAQVGRPPGNQRIVTSPTPTTPTPGTPGPKPIPKPTPKPAGKPPAAPRLHNATPGKGSVAMYWSPVPGATAYVVYRSGGVSVRGITGNSYTFTGLKPGTPYSFSVAATNRSGRSVLSNQLRVIVK